MSPLNGVQNIHLYITVIVHQQDSRTVHNDVCWFITELASSCHYYVFVDIVMITIYQKWKKHTCKVSQTNTGTTTQGEYHPGKNSSCHHNQGWGATAKKQRLQLRSYQAFIHQLQLRSCKLLNSGSGSAPAPLRVFCSICHSRMQWFRSLHCSA